MNYWLSVALGGLTPLSDKQIDAILCEYNKTGDKLGIKVQRENVLDATTVNTWNYANYLVKNNEKLSQIYQVVFGPAL